MRKFFTLLAILTLSLATFSCSSDDNTTEEKPIIPPKDNKLVLTSKTKTVKIGDTVEFETINAGKPIKDAKILEYGTDTPVPNNKWTATTRGSFAFYAMKEGYINSEALTIIVQDSNKLEGSGNFSYEDKNYNITQVKFTLDGIFESKNASKHCSWTITYLDEKNKTLIYNFINTAAKKLENGEYEYELPTPENILESSLTIGTVDEEFNFSFITTTDKNVKTNIVFGEKTKEDRYKTQIKIDAAQLGEKPFNLEYSGEVYFSNRSTNSKK